ncbi:MAG TPA: hypothetical protein VE953_11060 [Terriglobales bacterium]|nr:hypothetical protein [Terriglobales bacterium]
MVRIAVKERYYLVRDGSHVVREGHPDAASLYVAAGIEVDEEEARRLGLWDLENAVPSEPEPTAPEEDEGDDQPEEDEAEAAEEEATAPEALVVGKAVHKAQIEDKSLPTGLQPQPRRYTPPMSKAGGRRGRR